MTPTHLITGQSAYLLACVVSGRVPALAEAASALLGAVLPDLDLRQSWVGRLLPRASGWLEDRFGHRTLTHSLLLQAGAGLAAWAVVPPGHALALLAGWASHSLADMTTPAGVAWLWPSRVRCVVPGNPRYRIESGGRGELAFLVVVALLGALAMPLAASGLGPKGLIRAGLGEISAARRAYDAGMGSRAFTLSLRGRDRRTHADVSGCYPVLGPFAEAGFLVATPLGPRSVGPASAADWHPERAVLVPGDAEETTSLALQTPRIGARSLVQALAPLEPLGRVYLLGTFTAPGVHGEPPTVTVSGDRVTLAYASPDRVAALGEAPLREVDLVVQVRHAPGVAVPEVALPPAGQPALPESLSRWTGAGCAGGEAPCPP